MSIWLETSPSLLETLQILLLRYQLPSKDPWMVWLKLLGVGKCLSCGAQNLLYLDWHFWGSFNSINLRFLSKPPGLIAWFLQWGHSLMGLVSGTVAPKCTPSVGNYPVYRYSDLPGVLYSPESFKRMSAATKQTISLRLEWQQRNKENDQLQNCEPEVMTRECHRESEKPKTNESFEN